MVGYEYKVIPAPAKGLKARGVKGPEARFANALEHRINEMAADGWDYLRADILPSEERQGLTSTQTVYRSVLVFRRTKEAEDVLPDAAEDIIEDTSEEEASEDEMAEDKVTEEAEDASEADASEADTSPDSDDIPEDKK